MKESVEKIRCDEEGCGCVVAERRVDGTIIIRARHHGREHITIIPPWSSAQQKDLVGAGAVEPTTAPDASNLPQSARAFRLPEESQ